VAHAELAILGGGVCGLYIGSELKRLGHDFSLFEAQAVAGGLSRTVRTGRFSWDLGVHALYGKDPAFAGYLRSLPIEYQTCDREVKVCHVSDGAIHQLDYPFENGLRQLPDDDWEDCVVGYMESQILGRKEFAHLEDWIRNGLGSGIARCFMLPYNRKIWNSPLDRISLGLVSNKIEPEPFEKVLRGAMGQNFVGRAYQAKFLYPRGGVQELVDHYRQAVGDRAHLGAGVARIYPSEGGHTVEFADGSSRSFRTLISTIPLTTLIDALPYQELKPARRELRHNNTLFVMVGLKDGRRFGNFDSCHWVFFAHDEVFYRLTMMHNYSEDFPASVVAEYTVKDGEAVRPGAVAERVVDDLLRRGVLRHMDDIETVDTRYQDHTYPIPTVGLTRHKEFATRFLAERGIHLVGRSGAWSYLNIDGVVASADAFLKAFTPGLARELMPAA
jgi:protoporphyrinogen oxidase